MSCRLTELGWALSHVGGDRIIAIVNTASGAKPDDLPFDIRHRRALTYELPETADPSARKNVKKTLVAARVDALRTNLEQYIDDDFANQEIIGVAPAPDNRSIWASAKRELIHGDAFGRASQQTAILPDCPRAYMRIIPSQWKHGIPSVGNFPQKDGLAVWPPSGGVNGDYGTCEQGYVWYWITGQDASGHLETKDVIPSSMTRGNIGYCMERPFTSTTMR